PMEETAKEEKKEEEEDAEKECCRGVSLSAAAYFFRFEKAGGEKGEEKEEKMEGEEEKKEEEVASIYDRLALLAAQMDETSCESTSLLDLTLRVLSRANVNSAASRLVAATRSVVAVAAAAGKEKEEESERRKELSLALHSFIDRFNANETVLRGFGAEEETRRAYGLLAECDWTGVVSVLLSLPHDETTQKAIKFTARIIDGEECIGLFALAESSPALQRLLLKQLRMVEEREEKKEEIKIPLSIDDDFTYDETPRLDKKKRSGKELSSIIAHRLHVLKLVDELAEVNKGLNFESIDDERRIDVLHRLLRMIVTEEGESALSFVFSECAFSLLSSIISCVMDDKRWDTANKEKKRNLVASVRSSSAFNYTLEIMKTVTSRAERASFWVRNARHYQKISRCQQLLPPTSSLHEWWEPLNDGAIASVDLGFHTVISAVTKRLREYSTKLDDGDPPLGALTLLRIIESWLTDGRKVATPRGVASRSETILFCLTDGLPKAIEDILKKSVEYRLSLWSLGTSIEYGTGASVFREFALKAFKVLSLLYGASLDLSSTVKGLSVNAVGHAVGVWTLTSGVMKVSLSLGENGKELRRAVLSFLRVMSGFEYAGETELECDWEGKSALTRTLRRAMDYGKDRVQCQPAALSLLCHIQSMCTAGGEKWTKQFDDAIGESAKAIGVLLLNYAPYAREMAFKVFERIDATIGGEAYAALAKWLLSHLIQSIATRPKRAKNTIDKDDVCILIARSRHVALAKMFSQFSSSRRFIVALLQILHEDANLSNRLQLLLSLTSFPNQKTESHWEFQELLINVLSKLADHYFYEADTLAVGDMEEMIEEKEEEEQEEQEEEEEDEAMGEVEEADEFLDENCGVIEEEEGGEKKEEKEEKEEEKEK
ncbi:hypothetical protein PFISCL1PPCAC_18949, partial [Pristionchus fissidentatus]